MKRPPQDLACWALRHTERLPELTLPRWELLIRQARRADVLARIALQLTDRGLLDAVPPEPRAHLCAAITLAQAHRGEVVREAGLICKALQSLPYPVVLLKGAAYVMADLPAARGRLFSDTDILVPRAALAEVETGLMLGGWLSSQLDAYDQRYYREWMHELPPMEHLRRSTVLDVHHNILPLTVRRPPDAAKLLASARPLPKLAGAWVLAPVDMVLHSMTHLFHNDDLSHGLRDLSDLDLLLRHYGQQSDFWPQLHERAKELQLQRSLHYGLWATREILATPVPEGHDTDEPPWPLAGLMRALWRRGLRTPHPTATLPASGVALFALYLRAHYLRMPPLLLARHLSIKAWKRARAQGAGHAA